MKSFYYILVLMEVKKYIYCIYIYFFCFDVYEIKYIWILKLYMYFIIFIDNDFRFLSLYYYRLVMLEVFGYY